MGALKLTYAENLKSENLSHLRVAYNFFESNFSEKEVLSDNPLSFIDPDGGYDYNGGDDPDGQAAAASWDAGTDALWDMCPTCKPSDITDMYLAARNNPGGLSAAFEDWSAFNPTNLGYEEGLISNYEVRNAVDLRQTSRGLGYWQNVNQSNSDFGFNRENTASFNVRANSSIGITEEFVAADLGAWSRFFAIAGSAWGAVDLTTNHTTYTTTKGLTKNILKPNGQVRSAKAAQALKVSNLVSGISWGLAGGGIALDAYSVYTGALSPSKGALNTVMTGVGMFGGPVGWAVSGSYFLVDGTVGWGNAMNSAASIQKQNQAILGRRWRIMGNGLK